MNAALPRVVVLGSGAGSNFEALAEQAGGHYEIVAVGSDKADAPILDRARRHAIPVFSITPFDYPEHTARDAALARAIAGARPDWVALAGYMRLLGAETLAAAPGRILNVHPALLPAFPGLDTYRRVLAAGAREHGSTVHFVTAELDSGPPILQARLGIAANETVESLEARVKTMEHRIYPQALAWCAAGRVAMRDGVTWLDGKRLTKPIIVEETDE
ncbi:MAG: phosphoribosylglycinamide formyltransferase [Gammaproteobacteria bacterium]|nr:phosphoribosylglycinamide formyltransferase [Gammaproteobacteria bacterium]